MEIKIPFYNIVNMFLTGLALIGGCFLIFFDSLMELLENETFTAFFAKISAGPEILLTVCAFATAYELGLIVNRLGSVLLEPLLKVTKLIPFDDDYKKFNVRKKAYPIMSTLSREYALSRTGVSLFLILTALACHHAEFAYMTVFFAISIVYCLSCRKHASKIVSLMSGDEEE